jgi:hypothetical protein
MLSNKGRMLIPANRIRAVQGLPKIRDSLANGSTPLRMCTVDHNNAISASPHGQNNPTVAIAISLPQVMKKSIADNASLLFRRLSIIKLFSVRYLSL